MMSVVSPTCPIEQACDVLTGLRRRVGAALGLPPLLSIVAVVVVRYFDHAFYRNPILVCVLVLFLIGQGVLGWQLWGLRKRATSGLAVLGLVKRAGQVPDLAALEAGLLGLAFDPMRDLVLGWIGLQRHFGGEGVLELLRNSEDRRSLRDHAELGVHALINRVVLKVGFLGTLIGLLLTFPPMKRAVLGLSESDGEMTFIRDIAKAIDEDAYAIQATLVATGLSLLLEALVVQVLERFYGRFEVVESLLSDWNLTVLRPSRRLPQPETAGGVDLLQLQAKLAQGQQILDAHLDRLLETLGKTGQSLEGVARTQATLERRIQEISSWEQDYRAFLAAKQRAVAPPVRPEA